MSVDALGAAIPNLDFLTAAAWLPSSPQPMRAKSKFESKLKNLE